LGPGGDTQKSVGMFAIALWDRQTCTLALARDRIGEKPLYFGWQGKGGGRVFCLAPNSRHSSAPCFFSWHRPWRTVLVVAA